MSDTKKCLICNSTKVKSLGNKKSYLIIKCKNCLTIFVSGIGKSVVGYNYSNYYREENLITPEFVYETYRNVIREMENHRVNNRFLDVGCGAGALLEIAKEMSWEVMGVEVSKPATTYLRGRGYNVFEGSLEDAKFPDNYFDVITCTEVIEHVLNPIELINEMSRILHPKGGLWITTPNSCSLSEKLLGLKWNSVAPPEHLTLFSIKSLKKCLEDAGFRKFRFISSGINPFDIYRDFRSLRLSAPQIPLFNKEEKDFIEPEDKFDNSIKSCQLNTWFESGKGKRYIKSMVNFFLNKTKLGDTIKVFASFE